MSHYLLAYVDDWEGIYVDGVLVTEGHRIRREEYASIVGRDPCEHREANSEVLADLGNFPRALSDVVWRK